MSVLERLNFLVGRWRGRAVDQFGEKGVIETSIECAREPGDQFLTIRTESRKQGVLVNRSVQYILYDSSRRKYIRKAVFSYGFINNEEGDWEDDALLFTVTNIDNEPEYFKGIHWRGFIRRYSDDEVGLGLYIARPGEDFRLFGETRARRARD